MEKINLSKQFNARIITEKYHDIWNRGIHLRSINDLNRDFYYSIFYVDFLFVEVTYNKLNGNIMAIKSFTDAKKLMFYLNEDFC